MCGMKQNVSDKGEKSFVAVLFSLVTGEEGRSMTPEFSGRAFLLILFFGSPQDNGKF